jgi:hypothetical protein
MRVPDGDDYIEFILYKEPPAPTKRGSAHHLCLEVPSAAETVAALDKKAYRKQYTQPLEIRTGVNRKRQVNIFDPDGTRTEVMEPVTVEGKPAPSSNAPPPRWGSCLNAEPTRDTSGPFSFDCGPPFKLEAR